jgi:hypothetical protein
MIKLTDFLAFPEHAEAKIKFNMNAGDITKPAWDLLLNDSNDWLTMNRWKTKQANNNLGKAGYLLTFAQYYPYGPEYFIFGGLYKIQRIQPEVFETAGYNLTLKPQYQDYIKRLIIKLKQPIGRNIYCRRYENIQEGMLDPEVYELAPDTKIGNFTGYQNVSLQQKDLQTIWKNNEPSWKQALSYVKGVYVVTDISNCRLYIGSASGNSDGIWQRWSAYANPKHLTGGNKEFERVLKEDGITHITDNFRYSIIEIFDTKTKEETVLSRENYWKMVFNTQNSLLGMNRN